MKDSRDMLSFVMVSSDEIGTGFVRAPEREGRKSMQHLPSFLSAAALKCARLGALARKFLPAMVLTFLHTWNKSCPVPAWCPWHRRSGLKITPKRFQGHSSAPGGRR